MEYDGKYVKLADDPTFWAVDGGERVKLRLAQEAAVYGARETVEVTPAELARIPVKGESPPVKRTRTKKKEPADEA